MIQKKDKSVSKSWMISIGLISVVLPIILNYPLSLKSGQIAMGLSIILMTIIENKLIKRVIAVKYLMRSERTWSYLFFCLHGFQISL